METQIRTGEKTTTVIVGAKTRIIAMAAIIAAAMSAINLVFQPISFMEFQFHIATILTGFYIIYPRSALLGLAIGGIFMAFISPLGLIEMWGVPIFALTGLVIIISRKYLWSLALAYTLEAAVCGFWVAYMLWAAFGLPFWLLAFQVFLPEALLKYIAMGIFVPLKKKLPAQYLWEN